MISFLDPLREITFISIILRMLLSLGCGLLVGLERSAKNRPAGLRTHMLVCIAAAGASMTGHYLYLNMLLPADVSRIGAQVIQGLGFIGAGTIIVTKKQTVKGLTTAAGLWATGVCGLAIGAGFYEGGIAATLSILLIETVFSSMGSHIKRVQPFKVEMRYNQKASVTQIMRYCKDHSFAITELQISGVPDTHGEYLADLTLRPNSSMDPDILCDHIRTISGVVSVNLLQ